MIFVTLGTQRFQMNRLVQAADCLAFSLDDEVFIQSGSSTYIPKHCKYKNFIDAEDYENMIENCSLLITHSGIGTIMRGINAGKPVIVVPRLKEYNEHVDDHQKEIAEAFAHKHCVIECDDVHDLGKAIDKTKTFHFEPYVSHGGKIEDIISDFMDLF